MLICDLPAYNKTTLPKEGVAMLNPQPFSPSHPQSIMNILRQMLQEQIDNLEDQILEILAFEVDQKYLTWDIKELVERYYRIEDYIY